MPAGPKHPRVREFLASKRRPGHDQADPIAYVGSWMITKALAAGVRLRVVYVCPALLPSAALALVSQAVGQGAEVYQVSEKVMSRLTDRARPDGIAALGLALAPTLGDIRIGPGSRVMIADGWDLPGNLGTLIRCADGAGACGVLVIEPGFSLSHPLIVRASMGAALTTPVVAADRTAVRQWLRARAFRVVAADPAGSDTYWEIDYRGPLAIVVGSERRGLAPDWLAAADSIAAIPMLGSCDSLNAAVAGALLLYQSLAQAAGATSAHRAMASARTLSVTSPPS